MKDTITFNNAKELYDRVYPALSSKVSELRKFGIKHVNQKDIWKYLAYNVWCKKDNLELFEMVNDILYTDNMIFNNYVLSKNKEEI